MGAGWGGGDGQTDAGVSPRDLSPSGKTQCECARRGRRPTPPPKCSHLRRRARHEEVHSEAEVTSFGAGVLGRTVHV